MRITFWQVIAVLTLVVVAWMYRYEIVGANPYGTLYKLDRWTGSIEPIETQSAQGAVAPYGRAPYGRAQ